MDVLEAIPMREADDKTDGAELAETTFKEVTNVFFRSACSEQRPVNNETRARSYRRSRTPPLRRRPCPSGTSSPTGP